MSRYPRVPAKVGTVPKMVWLRSKKPAEIGKKIEYRTCEPSRWGNCNVWSVGLVTCIDPLKFDMWQ